MKRVRLYLVGSLMLLTVAGCGRGWLNFAEREPWRAEAEKACLQSGAVRETANLVRIKPISGPGVCGAEFPLKVAALGENSAIGYVADMRPPGSIPNAGGGNYANQPRWPGAQPSYPPPPANYQPPTYQPPPQRQAYPSQQAYPPQQAYPSQSYPADNRPVSLTPNVPQAEDEEFVEDSAEPMRAPQTQMRPQGAPLQPVETRPATSSYPVSSYPPQRSLPTLGPSRPNSSVMTTSAVQVKPTATLACPLVSALDKWIADAVQPAAMRWFGTPVAEIKQISAYSCRGMNGQAGAHISEHAFGNALDIAAFTLADGRTITVKGGWRGMPEEQAFLRDVQGAACQQFTTVLAPGSNVYHYDHIHVDLMRRSSGRVICQPAAVSGEAIAAKASGGRYAGRDGGYTGSIKKPSRTAKRGAVSDDDWIEDESHIR